MPVGKVKRRRVNREHGEQVALFNWAATVANMDGLEALHLLFAIPNERRSPKERRYFAAEGVKTGVPDICLPVARGPFHGLYIELKYGDNKATEAQKGWLEALQREGYLALVCTGFEEAKATIEEYLALDPMYGLFRELRRVRGDE